MSTTKGKEALEERYRIYGDPRTGKKLNAEEAHRKAAEVARRVERKEQDGKR